MDLTSTASNEDFYRIEEIGKKSLPIYYSQYDLLILGLTNHTILKIIDNNNIIGYIVYNTIQEERRLHIMSIGILEEYQRKNYGSKVIDHLKTIENRQITLYVQVNNTKAINFYQKNNFKVEKKIVGYYETLEVKDALYMVYDSSTL